MGFDRLFSDLLGSPSAKGALSGAASGALVSLLLNKKARKHLGGTALKLGGAAAVAGVGYYAYQQWQKRQAPTLPVASSPGGPAQGVTRSIAAPNLGEAAPPATAPVTSAALPPVDDSLAFKLIKTMIAAAQADGTIDASEMNRLETAVHGAGLTPAEDAAVMAALNQPPGWDEIARWPNTPAEAAELYGAALMTVDPDTAAEQFFLRRLATALRLPPELVAEMNASVRRT